MPLSPHPLSLWTGHPGTQAPRDERDEHDARGAARQWVLSRLEEAHDWEMRCGHDEKIGMAAIGQAFGAVSATALQDLAPGDARRAFLRCYRAVLQAWQTCDLEGQDSSGRSSIGSAVARLQAGAPEPWRVSLEQEWQATRLGDERCLALAQRMSDRLVDRAGGPEHEHEHEHEHKPVQGAGPRSTRGRSALALALALLGMLGAAAWLVAWVSAGAVVACPAG